MNQKAAVPIQSQSPNDQAVTWSPGRRVAASILLAAFLFVLVMGPVTNPVATEELTAPVARALSPIHQSLFLGHGYRFFAPDPGPGHLLTVWPEGTTPGTAGTPLLTIPDRDRIWPRLMYHRWFMLSETLWNEYASMPLRADLLAMQKRMDDQAADFSTAGYPGLARSLRQQRARSETMWQAGQARIDLLTRSIEQTMAVRTGGPVVLMMRERAIPMPGEILLRRKLSDESFLGPLRPLDGAEEIEIQ